MELAEMLQAAAEYARGISTGGNGALVVIELHPLGFLIRVDTGSFDTSRIVSYAEASACRVNLLIVAIDAALEVCGIAKAALT